MSLAILLNSSNSWKHELELSYSPQVIPLYSVSHTEEIAPAVIKTSFVSGQYELLRQVNHLDNRLQLLLGGGVLAYLSKIIHEPNEPNSYVKHNRYMGVTINITPHIIYKISERWWLDLNVKGSIYDVRQSQQRILNPSVPIEQQYDQETQYKFVPASHTLRFGLGYQI